MPPYRPAIDRFNEKYEVTETGCWQWTAATKPDGYAAFNYHFSDRARTGRAHRFSYEYFIGPIPDGLILDHLCRNRGCVNPEHLEPVTYAENTRRGISHDLKSHCKRGHEFSRENTYVYPRRGKNGLRRVCKACLRAARLAKSA